MVKRVLVAGFILLVSASSAAAQSNLLSTVQRVRADYPTPLSPAQQAELLNRVAWEHRAEGWGLLIKTGGNRCPAPQGVDVACDILVYAPNPWHYDVLVDSGGAGAPAWIDDGPCDPNVSGCAMDRFLAPIAPAGQVTVTGAFARAVGGDFDGNGLGDLLAQGGSGSVSLGLNSGAAFQTQTVFASATDWKVVGVGNFDRVGNPDVVWQHPSGLVLLWALNTSATPQTSYLFAGATAWRIAAVADVDRDTFPDLVWQDPSGQVLVWYMTGSTVRSTQFLWASSSEYRLAAMGDLNGDGNADVIWQAPSGQVVLWLMQGTTRLSSFIIFNGATSWRVLALADVDGNGRSDLVWGGPASHLTVWSMNAAQATGFLYVTLGSQWQIAVSPP
jgi:hypothetical protein